MKMALRKCYENDYVLEIWNCSTKKPDLTYLFSDFIENTYDEYKQMATINDFFIQWCAYIASNMIFEFTAIKILNYGFIIKYEYNGETIDSIYEMLETGYTIIVENNEVRLDKNSML